MKEEEVEEKEEEEKKKKTFYYQTFVYGSIVLEGTKDYSYIFFRMGTPYWIPS